MIDNAVYIFIISCLLITEMIFLYFFSKASWFYFTDGADIRVCSIAQYFVYGLLFTIEVLEYLITGKASTLFIFVARSHLIFSFFLLASCRLIGYRIMYSSPLLRNILYMVLCFFFYFTITMGSITFNTEILNNPNQTSNFALLSNISYYLRIQQNYPKSILIELIPSVYALLCFCIILGFDLTEKRSKLTIRTDIFLGISIIIFTITKIGTSCIYLDNLLVCIMYLIPIFGFVSESISVIKICEVVVDENEKLKNLIKRSLNLPSLKKKYNARLIAKMIKAKPQLEELLPKDKKHIELYNLIKGFLDE